MEGSKVEVKGLEAKFYDHFLDLITLGRYKWLIIQAIRRMRIKPDDRILDLGVGTGRNACMMANYLKSGKIVAVDIGKEMLRHLKKRAKRCKIEVLQKRIEETLPFKEEFDKVFISFVLHGFPQKKRLRIIDNVYRALKPGGEFFILDYGEFEISQASPIAKFFFHKIECPLALDFIKYDWVSILKRKGFSNFASWNLFDPYIRFFKAVTVKKG